MKCPTPLLFADVAILLLAHAAFAASIGRDADLRRTGWYPDQPGLAPPTVSSTGFGQRFDVTLTGSVYAQPLVHGGVLFVATENNWIYGLHPTTGAVLWSRNVDTPWNASDVPCGDLSPFSGITATPVIDAATGIAYFTSKTYLTGPRRAGWKLHAVLVATGAERPGFPVTLTGAADNAPAQTFNAATHNQRTGLLLLDGVVYAAFASVCDTPPFQGWVFGVSTAGVIKARWVDCTGSGTSGGGIWMSGSALVSDGTGQILLTTGNGMGVGTPTVPAPGHSPPADVCQSVVRLAVQANGTLLPTDFFTPTNASTVLDPYDGDLGAGGLVELPRTPFGTLDHPNVFVQIGKAGDLYLLDANSLGGYQQGPGGTDAVLQVLGPYGGVWSKPAVWGGDGGWVYMPTAQPSFPGDEEGGYLLAFQSDRDGAGVPTLTYMGASTDVFGFSSSAPVVTSNGSESGSAMLWIVWCPDATGAGAELRGYDVLPVSGVLQQRYAAPVGQGGKFNPPGVWGDRLYVGTRDGHVRAFGSTPSVTGVGRGAHVPPVLGAASPNPFTGATTLELSLARAGAGSLAVFDAGGRRVRTLASGAFAAGARRVAWDGRDDAGLALPAGLYFVRLDAAGARATQRVLLMR